MRGGSVVWIGHTGEFDEKGDAKHTHRLHQHCGDHLALEFRDNSTRRTMCPPARSRIWYNTIQDSYVCTPILPTPPRSTGARELFFGRD